MILPLVAQTVAFRGNTELTCSAACRFQICRLLRDINVGRVIFAAARAHAVRVIVAKCLDFLCFVCIATVAVTGFTTLFSTGRLNCNRPLTEIVTECINIICNIAIATDYTIPRTIGELQPRAAPPSSRMHYTIPRTVGEAASAYLNKILTANSRFMDHVRFSLQ